MKLTELITHGGSLKLGDIRADGVKQVQEALRRAGHELVPDGDYGPITKFAVERFQGAHGLAVDGVVGPVTAGALDNVPTAAAAAPPMTSILKAAPHLARMRAFTGIKEVPGPGDNPLILGWVKQISALYPDLKPDIAYYVHDAIAWCGLAVGAAWALGEPSFKPPRGLLGAGYWSKAGIGIGHLMPGVTMVYDRVGGHHVTMYESEDATHYYCRGGNQSDMVCVTKIPKSRPIIAKRWPSNLPVPDLGPVHGVTGNVVSEAREA